MLFNSYTFLLFFGLVLALHYSPLPWNWKKGNLLVASYLFYAAWNPPFVLLLVLSTVVDWFLARAMHRAEKTAVRRLLVVASLSVNLGLLAFFKYGTFLLENWVAALQWFGIHYQPAAPDIVLPVGISFYTFQTLSYTLDIYRRRAKPWHSFLDYAMYVTFFPQLVAGPIVRATDFLPQCDTPRRPAARQFGWGLTLMLLGLFQKIVVADGILAPMVERIYDVAGDPGLITAWCATLAFAGQIFCDFAGYSTCAIGAAICLGFALPDNFRFPYAAIGFSDFWRRWHISLSTWLRDYLYISLGGNRAGAVRTQVNLMATMLLGGLWHGASWTFVVWGALHGSYLVLERMLKSWLPDLALWRTRPARWAMWLGTFALVNLTWVFFRADNFPKAFAITSAMLGFAAENADVRLFRVDQLIVVVTIGAILGAHWLLRERTLESFAAHTPWWLRSAALAAMMVAIVLMPGEDRAFIYFQF